MSQKVTKVNVYRDAENNWFFAAWCGEEYDTNGQIDDAESGGEAIEWAKTQWPNATVKQVQSVWKQGEQTTTANNTTIRNEILSVIRDGSRIDRFIEAGPNGQLFITTENTENDQIKIGCGSDTTEDEEAAWADSLLAEAENTLL